MMKHTRIHLNPKDDEFTMNENPFDENTPYGHLLVNEDVKNKLSNTNIRIFKLANGKEYINVRPSKNIHVYVNGFLLTNHILKYLPYMNIKINSVNIVMFNDSHRSIAYMTTLKINADISNENLLKLKNNVESILKGELDDEYNR